MSTETRRIRAKIEDVVAGSALTYRATIDREESGLESGAVLTKAWMTFKDSLSDADPGIVQKIITTTDVPGTGQIEDDGSGDVDPVVRFDLQATDTELLVDVAKVAEALPTEKYYDVKVLANLGGPYTGELGLIYTWPPATKAKT